MRLSRWIFGIVLLLALVSLAQRISGREPNEASPVEPESGRLAPPHYDWAGEWTTVGRAPVAEAVVGIAGYRDTLFLLQEHGWSRLVKGGHQGPFEVNDSVASTHKRRSRIIAAVAGRVYVLDSKTGALTIWKSDGTLIEQRSTAQLRGATQIRADAVGRLFAVVRPRTNSDVPRWTLVRLLAGADSPAVLYTPPTSIAIAGGVLNALVIDVRPTGEAVVAGASDFSLHWLDTNGNHVREDKRPDLPRWRIPSADRERYEKVLAKAPAQMRAMYQLPEYAPVLRDVVADPSGRLLVMTMTPGNRVVVELCDSTGAPLGRLTRGALPDSSTFITGEGIFRVTESAFGPPRIERRRLSLPSLSRGDK